jgi:hypothetical protein
MKAKIMIVMMVSVLVAGCAHEDAYYTTSYHEPHPHLHTSTVSHGYAVAEPAPHVESGHVNQAEPESHVIGEY